MNTTPSYQPLGQSPDLLNPRMIVGLAMLREALEASLSVGRDTWEFAIELGQLHAAGLSNTDIRLMLCGGLAEHGQEHSGVKGQRLFHRLANLTLPEESCFILTRIGLHFATRLSSAGTTVEDASPAPRLDGPHLLTTRPNWDGKHRQLHWNGFVIKHFRVPAPNQESILAALEEEGWPPRIDDPIAPSSAIDSRERLHDAIKGLNRHQIHRLLSFRGDGTGEGIMWQAIPTASPDRP